MLAMKDSKDILDLPKYGNDHKECDEMAIDLYEYVAKESDKRIDNHMDYYLIVISNNQTNTIGVIKQMHL
ncbi:MAG: pyruvate formate lyase family protein [Faecalibacillus faecis]